MKSQNGAENTLWSIENAQLSEIVAKYTKKIDVNKISKPQDMFAFEKHQLSLVSQEAVCMAKQYPIIDLSFLKSKQKDGNPKFAIFSPTHAKCFMSITVTSRATVIDSNFKRFILKYYRENLYKLGKIACRQLAFSNGDEAKVTLESTFEGLIPEKSRNLISDQRVRFDAIFIIKEATNWTLSKEVISYPKSPDPLTIGIIGEVAFLLDKFDVTPAEDYIAREFTFE